jgi:hypothetical protein
MKPRRGQQVGGLKLGRKNGAYEKERRQQNTPCIN